MAGETFDFEEVQLEQAVAILRRAERNAREKIEVLTQKQQQWNATQTQINANLEAAHQKIRLDVGGKLFATSKSTLLTFENTFFHAMLSSGRWLPDNHAQEDPSSPPSPPLYFIDRNPKLFSFVLDFLRSYNDDIQHRYDEEAEALLPSKQPQLLALRREADFYGLQPLLHKQRQRGKQRRKQGGEDLATNPRLLQLDAMELGPNVVLSGDLRTAVKRGNAPGHASILAKQGFVSGLHSWLVAIHRLGASSLQSSSSSFPSPFSSPFASSTSFPASHWIAVGVCRKERLRNRSNNYASAFAISSKNQLWRADNEREGRHNAGNDWIDGDVLRVTLSLEQRLNFVRIENLRTGRSERIEWRDDNDEEERLYYPYFNLYNVASSFSVLDYRFYGEDNSNKEIDHELH
ncbi:K+ channel tetramerization domain-containing protein [Balamuthia mandrillaris]